MTRPMRAAVALLLFAALACDKSGNAQRGAAAEERLMAATVAADVAGVKQALASGADPNKLVTIDGHYQAPWKVALRRLRPGQPAYTAIVQAMLAAHADPAVAWGEEPSRRGGYSEQRTTPILEAQFYDVPAAVVALVAAGVNPRGRDAATALVLACENRQHEMVHALVEAGVPVNTTQAAGTPLVAAIGARDVALVNYLEAHGAREKP